MALVTAADLKEYLKEEVPTSNGDSAIAVAEAAVAAYLDTPSLEEATVIDVVYTARETSLIELTKGPMTELLSVAIDGEASPVSDWETHFWAIQRPLEPVVAGARVAVELKRGWTITNVPEQIRAAVLAVAAEVWARPDASVVRIGTEGLLTAYNRTFITPSVEVLLRRFRRPR